jgi:hypothetical protein
MANWPWPTIIAGAALAGFLWVNFGRPWKRQRALKSPCMVHFVLRPEYPAHNYVLHDTERHHVMQLALAPNSEYEIEVGFFAKVSYKETEIVFGCEGAGEPPYAVEWIDSFSDSGEVKRYRPGEHEGHSLDIHKFYHRRAPRVRNRSTHFVNGFRLLTRTPGRYRACFGFLTEEDEGNTYLEIIVEDNPRSRMRCIRHKDCYVKPLTRTSAGT